MKNRVVIGGRYQYAPLECLRENKLYSEYRAYDKVTKKDLILQIHKVDDPLVEKLRDIKHTFIQGIFDLIPLEDDGQIALLLEAGKICSLESAIRNNNFIQ